MSGSIFQAAAEISVGERDGAVAVTFRRIGDLSQPVNITYDVTSESTTPGQDFTGASGIAHMNAGDDFVTVNFPIINDTLAEPTETFIVSIVTVDSGTLLVPRTTRVNILDDETPTLPPADPPLVPYARLETETLISGLNQPISFQFSPVDPEVVYVAEKGGLVRGFNVATGADLGVFVDLRSVVNDNSDRGLMDIAIHPNFPDEPYIYAFYVVDPAGLEGDSDGNRFSHVVRFTADASANFMRVVPDSGVIIAGQTGRSEADISGGGLQDFTDPVFVNQVSSEKYLRPNDPNPPTVIGGFKQNYLRVDSSSHAGGSLAFGPDGMLYISTGDGSSFDFADPRAVDVQSLNSLAGKILRVDPMTGQGLTDNPFYQAGQSLDANASKVYQYGLRNPFSIAIDDQGRIFITDTGWNAYEEINTGPAGSNFGWPYYEGKEGGQLAQTTGYATTSGAAAFYAGVANGSIVVRAPYAAFGHAAGAPGYQNQAITGGDVIYTGNRYPEAFQGDYFFSNFPFGQAFSIDTHDRQEVNYLFNSSTAFAPIHYTQGPDGYVYYSELGDLGTGLTNGLIGRIHIDPPPLGALVNGSFEQSTIPTGSNSYTSIPGWTVLPGTRIEMWKDYRGVTASDGVNFVELDYANAWDGFYQDVPTAAGQSHTLTFDLKLRPDRPNYTQDVQILWNGTVVATTTPSANWTTFTVTNLIGSGGADRLTVREVEAQSGDAGGAMIDNFKLTPLGPPPPTISVSATPATVTEAPGANANIAFTLSAVQTSNVTVTYSTANGTAVAGSDFTGRTNATATILAGQTSVVVQVPVIDDTIMESAETFSVNLVGAAMNGSPLTVAGGATVTIAANDSVPTVSISATPASVTEGTNPNAIITFTLNAAQSGNVTVTYSTVNGTAVAGSDFTGATNATAVILAGQTSVTAQIPLINDAIYEPSEAFSVNLVGATLNGNAIQASGSAAITIVDNEVAPTITVSATPASVTEGTNANAVATFTLNAAQSSNVTVTYSTVNGTAVAGSDFTGATNATVTILAGQTSVTAQIPLINDSVYEPSEAFSVNLVGATLNGNAIPASGSATITIADNDPIPTVTVAATPASVTEGTNPNAAVTFTLDAAQASNVTVRYSTVNGTATAGSDFTGATNATATILAGQTSVTAQIPLINNALTEATESFSVNLLGATLNGNAIQASGSAAITIIDDDAPPSGTNLLTNGSFEQPVIPTGSSNYPSVPGWTLLPGTRIEMWKAYRGVTASDGVNFVELDYANAWDGFYQDVQTASGQSYSLSFDLKLRPDRPNSTQDVQILWKGAVVATATPGTNWGTFTVTNLIGTGGSDRLTVREVQGQSTDAGGAMIDNFKLLTAGPVVPTVTVAATPASVTEGTNPNAVVTFTLNAAQSSNVTVTYSTVNGTAVAGSDFTAVTNATATILAGQTSATAQVALLNDSIFEPAEAFSVNLVGATLNGNAIQASGSTAITIADNDAAPSVSIAATPTAVTEGTNPNAVVTFTLNAVQSSNVTVTYSTVNGTAVAGSDFTGATNATAVILAGQASVTAQIPLINDAINEPGESFSVNLVGATLNGNAIPASGSATITVADNDAPPTGTNLLANGSFEQSTIPTGSNSYTSIPGWTVLPGTRIEMWKDYRGVTASDGGNLVELDYANAWDGFYQNVQTTSGQSYSLSFDLKLRPDRPNYTQDVQLLWNGNVVATTTPGADWSTFTVSNLVGTGGSDRLTVREVEAQSGDAGGAMVDNFKLIAAVAAPLVAPVAAKTSTIVEKVAIDDEAAASDFDLSAFAPAMLAPFTPAQVGGSATSADLLFEPVLTPLSPAAYARVKARAPGGDFHSSLTKPAGNAESTLSAFVDNQHFRR